MHTIFELKEKMATLQASINADAEWISEKAADPSIPMADIEAKTAHRDELLKRFNLLKKEHDDMETAQKAALQKQQQRTNATDNTVAKKAAFYRTALTGGDVSKLYEGLGAIPANTDDLGHGENLLPVNMSRELITEPLETNTLRQVEPVSQITGLSEPKLGITIEDADLDDVTDKETAKEIEAEGDTVEYGRFKTKIVATIKDTVLYGTDTNLVETVEASLRSGLAIKEKINAFRTEADSTHDHMSFYLNSIKTVQAEKGGLIDAIIQAWAELPDAFAGNASVVMRKTDYFAEIRTMANGATDLWGKKPEDVIGIPVIFNDRAVKPIVGDFRYSRQNYDIDTVFETDKDGKKGEYYFILTAWGDHRIKLKSAFRVVEPFAGP